MAISFKKYIDIVSAVGGAAATQARELIARLFVDNVLLPAGAILEFTTLESVGLYFGTDSQEYKRARFYFGFVSKQVTTPKKISFARWVSTDTAPLIIGGQAAPLATFTAIAAGDFYLTIDGETNQIDALDFTACVSMANVATVLQTRINAFVSPQFADATVTYQAGTGRFIFTGGAVNTADTPIVISVADGDDTPSFAGDVLRWIDTAPVYTKYSARWSNGTKAQEPEACFALVADEDNNFGSFTFISALTEEQVVNVATQNDGRNVEFMYSLAVLAADLLAWYAALDGIGGFGFTLLDSETIPQPANEYPEMLPMAILASTDFNRPDASQNYMYQEADLTPIIKTTTESDALDAIRVNYYGQTQQAGRPLSFYQRGYMNGQSGDPLDMNTYVGEIWIKDNIGVELINLQMALTKISANKQGRATVLSGVQVAVDRGLFNGVISVGKPLTNTQKAYISNATGQPDAWRQVQNVGYWLDCFIEQYAGPGGEPEYKARYVLIYAKDDVVRKIEGSDILI